MSDILDTILSKIPEPAQEKAQAPEVSNPQAETRQGMPYHPDFEKEYGKRRA